MALRAPSGAAEQTIESGALSSRSSYRASAAGSADLLESLSHVRCTVLLLGSLTETPLADRQTAAEDRPSPGESLTQERNTHSLYPSGEYPCITLEEIVVDSCALSGPENAFYRLVSAELDNYIQLRNHKTVLLFPPVSSRLRYLIHKLTEPHTTLSSFSVGEGWERRTVICHADIKLSTPEEDTRNRSHKSNNSWKWNSYKTGRGKQNYRQRKNWRPDKQVYVPTERVRREDREDVRLSKDVKEGKHGSGEVEETGGCSKFFGEGRPTGKDSREQGMIDTEQHGDHALKVDESTGSVLENVESTSNVLKVGEFKSLGLEQTENMEEGENKGCAQESDKCKPGVEKKKVVLEKQEEEKLEGVEEKDVGEKHHHDGSEPGKIDEKHMVSEVDRGSEVDGKALNLSDGKVTAGTFSDCQKAVAVSMLAETTSTDLDCTDHLEQAPELGSPGSEGKIDSIIAKSLETVNLEDSGDSAGVLAEEKAAWALGTASEKAPTDDTEPVGQVGPILKTPLRSECVDNDTNPGTRDVLHIVTEEPMCGNERNVKGSCMMEEVTQKAAHKWIPITEDPEKLAHILNEIRSHVSVEGVSIQPLLGDFSEFKELQTDPGKFGHVIEVYGFSPELRTEDLEEPFTEYRDRGFSLKWVDESHALAIFSCPEDAFAASCRMHSAMKFRPLSQGTHRSKSIAYEQTDVLLPFKERPVADLSVAKRMLNRALGLPKQAEEPSVLQ